MTFTRTLLWSSALAGSLLVTLGSMTGCGSSDADDRATNDDNDSGSGSSGSNTSSGSANSASSSSGGDAGIPIPIPENATVRWTSSGGAPNDFEECVPPDDYYTYVLAGRSLTWRLCRPDSVSPKPVNGRLQGDANLTAQQDAEVRKALLGVVPNAALRCDGEQPTFGLVISEHDGADTQYYDQSFHCADDGLTYVDGLAAVGDAFARAVPTVE